MLVRTMVFLGYLAQQGDFLGAKVGLGLENHHAPFLISSGSRHYLSSSLVVIFGTDHQVAGEVIGPGEVSLPRTYTNKAANSKVCSNVQCVPGFDLNRFLS